MLKRVFMAPDPGRTRLRFATRAVLGIAFAVALCGLAGHSLTGAVTGGLAALLALFTVTDAPREDIRSRDAGHPHPSTPGGPVIPHPH